MTNENVKEITEDIDPADIIMDDDFDMPQPETKTYEQILKVTPKFISLFAEAVGPLPYATTLKNNQGNAIKLIDLVKFVEAKQETGFTATELNTVLTFIATAEFKYVRPLMEVVENKQAQAELWTIAN